MKAQDKVLSLDAPTRGEGFVVTLTAKTGSLPLVVRKGFRNGQRRRQIVITNTDSALNLRVALARPLECPDAADDDFAILIFPKTTISLFTDSDVTVTNGNAEPIRIAIAEIFYVDP